jgi:DNA-binding transcriptional regulator YiaG
MTTAQEQDTTKLLRRMLGLTADEFAARFRMPLDELLSWAEGRAEIR